MHSGKLVFAQLMELLPLYEFQKCVQRYQGDYKVQSFSYLDQFLCMAFAQLTYRESLRDIESCLRAMKTRLYHMGIRGNISRSTLASLPMQMKQETGVFNADFAQVLISIGRSLYLKDDFGVQLEQTAYAFDSTTIDLCLSLFPWARFRKNKGTIKLHTLLNLRGNIPEFIHITEGKIHDVNILDLLISEPGSFYIMDRGYLDFKRLYAIHQARAFFVPRAKRNIKFRRRYSRPVDKYTGLRSDQTNHPFRNIPSLPFVHPQEFGNDRDKYAKIALIMVESGFSAERLLDDRKCFQKWTINIEKDLTEPFKSNVMRIFDNRNINEQFISS